MDFSKLSQMDTIKSKIQRIPIFSYFLGFCGCWVIGNFVSFYYIKVASPMLPPGSWFVLNNMFDKLLIYNINWGNRNTTSTGATDIKYSLTVQQKMKDDNTISWLQPASGLPLACFWPASGTCLWHLPLWHLPRSCPAP